MHILILEDDFTLSKEITTFFQQRGIECDCIYDGLLFVKQAQNATYDAYVLDINVPGINGIEVCKVIRKTDPQTPILILTAFGEIEEKTAAFQHGADDYLVKPFHFDELYLRIIALMRRKSTPIQVQETITIENLLIHMDELSVSRNNVPINLTPKEFKLLSILAKAEGRVVSKQQIADSLWDYNIESSHNTIEVYINFLRKKIDKDAPVKLIHTKPGYGYFIKALDGE